MNYYNEMISVILPTTVLQLVEPNCGYYMQVSTVKPMVVYSIKACSTFTVIAPPIKKFSYQPLGQCWNTQASFCFLQSCGWDLLILKDPSTWVGSIHNVQVMIILQCIKQEPYLFYGAESCWHYKKWIKSCTEVISSVLLS